MKYTEMLSNMAIHILVWPKVCQLEFYLVIENRQVIWVSVHCIYKVEGIEYRATDTQGNGNVTLCYFNKYGEVTLCGSMRATLATFGTMRPKKMSHPDPVLV